MRLLVLTQKVDKEDPVLGFFHNWLTKLSLEFQEIFVICLQKGESALPPNVKVYSLGKETGRNKLKFIFNFFKILLFKPLNYDAVFVHMNQEYVLLGGWFWKLAGKKIYLWRNHPQGNIYTRIAVWFSDKVFCTSASSFTAKFKKTVRMPVGIDMEIFKDLKMERLKNSMLFLGRIAPIKRPDLLIEALNILNKKGTDFTCNIYGDALPKDKSYEVSLKEKVQIYNLTEKVRFLKGVPNYQTPAIYNEHEIFVNLTPAGSLDKTIFEAAACGCLIVVSNMSLVGEINERFIVKGETSESIAQSLEFWLKAKEVDKRAGSAVLSEYVLKNHSLYALINRFVGLLDLQ